MKPETPTKTELRQRVADLETQLSEARKYADEGWEAFYKLREQCALGKYPTMTAEVFAVEKRDATPCVHPVGMTTCGYTRDKHVKGDGSPMDHEFMNPVGENAAANPLRPDNIVKASPADQSGVTGRRDAQ